MATTSLDDLLNDPAYRRTPAAAPATPAPAAPAVADPLDSLLSNPAYRKPKGLQRQSEFAAGTREPLGPAPKGLSERILPDLERMTRRRPDGERSATGAILPALGRAGASATTALGGTLEMASQIPGPLRAVREATGFDPVGAAGEKLREVGNRQQQMEGVRPSQSVEEGTSSKTKMVWERGLEAVPQLAGQLALGAATGGLGTAGQFAAFAAPTLVLEGGLSYDEAIKKNVEQGMDEDSAEGMATLQGLATGTGSAALETLPFGAFFGKVPGVGKFLRRRALKAVGRGGVKTVRKAAGSLAGRVAGGVVGEGSEEALQELWGDTVDYAIRQDPAAFEDLGTRMWDSFLVGGAVGGVAGGVMGGADKLDKKREARKALKTLHAKAGTPIDDAEIDAVEAAAQSAETPEARAAVIQQAVAPRVPEVMRSKFREWGLNDQQVDELVAEPDPEKRKELGVRHVQRNRYDGDFQAASTKREETNEQGSYRAFQNEDGEWMVMRDVDAHAWPAPPQVAAKLAQVTAKEAGAEAPPADATPAGRVHVLETSEGAENVQSWQDRKGQWWFTVGAKTPTRANAEISRLISVGIAENEKARQEAARPGGEPTAPSPDIADQIAASQADAEGMSIRETMDWLQARAEQMAEESGDEQTAVNPAPLEAGPLGGVSAPQSAVEPSGEETGTEVQVEAPADSESGGTQFLDQGEVANETGLPPEAETGQGNLPPADQEGTVGERENVGVEARLLDAGMAPVVEETGRGDVAQPGDVAGEVGEPASMPARAALSKPIQGPTGHKIIGYYWPSMLVEGMFRDRRVSDWSRAGVSERSGRAIVHQFYVQAPDGTVSLQGMQSAEALLGISESRLKTIAKNEREAQRLRQKAEKDAADSYEKTAASSLGDANRSAAQRNVKPEESMVLTKDGKYIRLGRDNPIASTLKDRGWDEQAPAQPSGIAGQLPAQAEPVSQTDPAAKPRKVAAIIEAVGRGGPIYLRGAWGATRLTKPAHVRAVNDGTDLQVASGRSWVWVTLDQLNDMAAQAGVPIQQNDFTPESIAAEYARMAQEQAEAPAEPANAVGELPAEPAADVAGQEQPGDVAGEVGPSSLDAQAAQAQDGITETTNEQDDRSEPAETGKQPATRPARKAGRRGAVGVTDNTRSAQEGPTGPPDFIQPASVGRDAKTTSADSARTYPAKYAVVRLDDLTISHDRNDGPNPAYFIGGAQNRAGVADRARQNIIPSFDPDQLLFDSPTSDGPIGIDTRGQVIYGNARAWALREMAERDDRRYLADYAARLTELAGWFGVDADAVREITKTGSPMVLVKMHDVEDMSFTAMRQMGADSNARRSAALSAQEMARTVGNAITAEEISARLDVGEKSTLGAEISKAPFVQWLNRKIAQLGLRTEAAPLFDDGRRTKLSSMGRDLIERVIFNRIIGDLKSRDGRSVADTLAMDRDYAGLRQVIDKAMIDIWRNHQVAQGNEWDVMEAFREALGVVMDHPPAEGMSPSEYYYTLMEQGDMLAGATPPGLQVSQRARDILKALAKVNEPTALRKTVREFFNATKISGDLIGGDVTADQAWDSAAGPLRQWIEKETRRRWWELDGGTDPNTRRSTTQSAQQPPAQTSAIQQTLDKMARRWKNAPKGGMIAVDSVAQLSPALRAQTEKYQSESGELVRGIYDPLTDRVWIIRENMGDADAEFLVLHEVIGHRGLEAILGKESGRFYYRLSVGRAAEIRAYAEREGMKFGTTDERVNAAREWLADRIGAREFDGIRRWLTELADLIRRAWAQITGKPLSSLRDAELARLVAVAHGWTERGGQAQRPDGIRFSTTRGPGKGKAKADMTVEEQIAGVNALLDELEAFYQQAKTEVESGKPPKPLGRPDLALAAEEPEARQQQALVDEARKRAGKPEVRKDEEVIAEANQRIEADYEGEKAKLLKVANDGGMLNDVDTLVAMEIVARETLKASRSNDVGVIRQMIALSNAYRQTGTEQARAMRQRRDKYRTPAQRWADALADGIVKADPKINSRLDQIRKEIAETQSAVRKAELQAERDALIAEQARKVVALKAKLAKRGIDLDTIDPENMTKDEALHTWQEIATAKASYWDKQHEYWISAILSGLQTHAANFIGNTVNSGWDMTFQRSAEALVNMIAKDPNSAQWGEFPAMFKGMIPGFRRGVRVMMQAWRTEMPVFQDELFGYGEGVSRIETLHGPKIAGKKGRIIRMPLRALLAMDEFQKSIVAEMQAGALAYRKAKAEGLTGKARTQRQAELLNDTTSEIWEEAYEAAVDLAFQTELGPWAQVLNNMRGKLPGARYILPFIKTPTNIFKTGVRKTPLGAGLLIYKLATRNPSYTKRQAIKHAGEQVIALAMTFGLLDALGMLGGDDDDEPWITGSMPYQASKQGERELAYRTQPPNSIRIGDTWYSYNRIEPFAVMLSTTVDLLNNVRRATSEEETNSAVGNFYAYFVSQIKDKTYMRGLSDVIEALNDPSSATRWASSFTASWMPNIVRQTGRQLDTNIRETGLWGKDAEFRQRYVDRVAYQVLPSKLTAPPPRVDLWGNEIRRDVETPVPATDFLYRLLAPVQRIDPTDRPETAIKLDRLILNWNNAHPNDTFAPQRPQKRYTVRGEAFYLSDEEYFTLSKRTGEMALRRLAGRVDRMDIENPTERDIKAIDAALKSARESARAQMIRERRSKR